MDFQMTAEASSTNGRPQIEIFDRIGKDQSGIGTDLKEMRAFLNENHTAPEIDVLISSLGGSAHEGLALYEALKAFPGKVTTIAIGVVASAAAIVFMAGSRRRIAPTAGLMFHEPRFRSATGTSTELRKLADRNDQITDKFVGILRTTSRQSDAKIRAWLADEKWFTAQEALKFGFATEIEENLPHQKRQFPNAEMLASLDGIPDHILKAATGPQSMADLVTFSSAGIPSDQILNEMSKPSDDDKPQSMADLVTFK